MTHDEIKSILISAIRNVSENISQYTFSPEKDLVRHRKFPADQLLSFLISEGSSSTSNEILDYFNFSNNRITSSALNQQRDKLKSEALEAVLYLFNEQTLSANSQEKYRFIAADGSTATFFSTPKFSSDKYLVDQGHSQKGFYSIHINAFQDIKTHTYTDIYLQSAHEKDEYMAFCKMVDRHPILSGIKNVYIGDRGYCSYNNMAHVINSNQYFLFRTKDITSKGLVGKFDYPDSDCFDVDINVSLVRSHSKKIPTNHAYRRFVDANTTFDYLEYGSDQTYDLSFRVVRFLLSENTYECLVTNLPREEFSITELKILYFARWSIESSFRKLKYTIGMSNFHSYKPEFIKQEIYARIIHYNVTETIINNTIVEKKDTKHTYKINFTVAAHISRAFLRLTTKEGSIDVMEILKTELIPIRNERQYPRLKTAHFRKPRYFIYRAA